jgi:hypothetical protein
VVLIHVIERDIPCKVNSVYSVIGSSEGRPALVHELRRNGNFTCLLHQYKCEHVHLTKRYCDPSSVYDSYNPNEFEDKQPSEINQQRNNVINHDNNINYVSISTSPIPVPIWATLPSDTIQYKTQDWLPRDSETLSELVPELSCCPKCSHMLQPMVCMHDIVYILEYRGISHDNKTWDIP